MNPSSRFNDDMNIPIWTPTPSRVKSSNMTRYMNWLKREKGLSFTSYADLHQWSVTRIADFWESIWEFCEVRSSRPYHRVVGTEKMPATKWFEGARFNFTENLLRRHDEQWAIVSWGEGRGPRRTAYRELFNQTAAFARSLKETGVRPGDRIVGYLPTITETTIAMLASASLGAVWSSCSPDFGVQGVLDRFGQIDPKLFVTADGYFYNGKRHPILDRVSEIVKNLPTLEKTVVVPYLEKEPRIEKIPHTILWNDFTKPNNGADQIAFEQLPFDHPLLIAYSSGTTGKPKCFIHGTGGVLLHQMKELVLHADLKPDDRIFYFTTCGWMMWNWLMTSLATGATVVIYEGSPLYPNPNILWEMASKEKATHFGTSPKFLTACEKAGVSPGRDFDLPTLRTVLSTGSPLSVENFEWVYKNIKSDLHLASISGGTDIMGCFMLGNPNLPVYPGEIQCWGLGVDGGCFNEKGKPVRGQKGELVCKSPMPSMPVGFWNDPDRKEYRSAYFEQYPDVWRHGDFIEITEHGGIIIYGRSDATLNPGGVRIGTAEIYRQVGSIPEIVDSLVVGQRWENDIRVILFVVPRQGVVLDDPLRAKIREVIRKGTTPRHVPGKILQVKEIPYTVSGKKVELAVTNLIHHEPVKNREALVNPSALLEYQDRPELKEN